MNKRWIGKAAMTLGVLTMVGSAGAGFGVQSRMQHQMFPYVKYECYFRRHI